MLMEFSKQAGNLLEQNQIMVLTDGNSDGAFCLDYAASQPGMNTWLRMPQKEEENLMKTVAKIFVGVLLVGLLGFGVIQMRRLFVQPLAEPLSIQTHSQKDADQLAQDASDEAATKETQATAVPQGLCGSTGKMQLLLTGADYSIGMPPLGADAIRLINIDFDNEQITTVAFPRAMMVNTEALDDPKKNSYGIGNLLLRKKAGCAGHQYRKSE